MALWFPYVATLMLFIFVDQPARLPAAAADRRDLARHPGLGHLRRDLVDLGHARARARDLDLATHFEGIRYNGVVRYLRSWIPEVPKALLPMIIVIEVLSQFMRLISLSVRLYANMLAGHILILTFIGLIFVFESIFAIPLVAFSAIFYIFEVVIVVGIQAFIFAILSAIYIGSAIEPEH